MAKKNKREVDFETKISEFKNLAEKYGFLNDISFSTLLVEFERAKLMCDELWKTIQASGVMYEGEGSMGQKITKTNPAVSDYNKWHTSLVKDCQALQEYIDKIPSVDENDAW